MKLKIQLILAFATAFLIGCGQGTDDIHSAPRETKAYESADLANMDLAQLGSHLQLLAVETEKAVESEQLGELHHLEVAITATIEAVEKALPAERKAKMETSLGMLKSLALKLHGAGHDQNGPMAKLISKKLTEVVDETKQSLASDSST